MAKVSWIICYVAIVMSIPHAFGSDRGSLTPRAPTIYIVAKASYDGSPSTVRIRGATNLPPFSVLLINVYDSIGQGSQTLSNESRAAVSVEGFFETTVIATSGQKFRHNMVCNVVFMPQFPSQKNSVLGVVGSHGEHLGFPRNPQAEQHSGEYYLTELIHVP
jgi:hypothetical protein